MAYIVTHEEAHAAVIDLGEPKRFGLAEALEHASELLFE